MLKFKSKISNYLEFNSKLVLVCKSLNIEPDWLYEVINIETAGSFNPAIRNAAGSGATGLIQFMPSTAKWLGTTTDALAKMSNVQQLDYVKKYFVAMFKSTGVPKSFFDLYLVVFQPAWVGKPDTATLAKSAYSMNRGIDLNKDGIITKGEFRTWATKNIKGFSSALTDTSKKLCPHCLQFY